MNINATPETVQAVAQVLKMAKILDDRMGQPDKARIAAWAEQVQRHRLVEGDLLDGLQAFYDGPSSHPIGVGDLIHHAKSARVVRIGKEERADREARQALLDEKADPDEPRAIVAAFVPGPVPNKTTRMEAAEQALQECFGKKASIVAIREFFEAKSEASGKGRRGGRAGVGVKVAPRGAQPPETTPGDEQ
ncbi:hypothetical protein SEA_NITZEL_70 [Mycobacterium phage Nitzel]|uniref:DnaC-like helicase loader n=1 Tax=Mycobacterium phage Nitzel TaxID=2652404 RepID=A0A5J6T3B2_9CAUD|nr:hypothetical protein I5H70_gp70 [Mycobacterium phage Nitzel]QFG04896.1 hypothetical protein SEA_NITZEL_70 [Mycobacterium phage Nitzel]